LERIGRSAIERALAEGRRDDPILADSHDAEELYQRPELPWFKALRICGQCGQEVPPGEVSEGLSNALPPDSRGRIDLKVLCPTCQVQTPHQLTPWGIPMTGGPN
jgi:hypothetical protein